MLHKERAARTRDLASIDALMKVFTKLEQHGKKQKTLMEMGLNLNRKSFMYIHVIITSAFRKSTQL
jgi:hypothetical protein